MLEIYPPPYEGIYHPVEIEYEILFKNSDLENKYQEYCKREIIAKTLSRRVWFQWNIAKCHVGWRDEFNRSFTETEADIFPVSNKNLAIRSIQLFEQNGKYLPEQVRSEQENKLNSAKEKYQIV